MKPLTPNGKMASELISPEDALKGSKASSSTAATSSTDDKLRRALEDASARDATAKAALAKSDAVILELRASVRNLKRHLEKMTAEKEQGDALQAKLRQELERLEHSAEDRVREEQESHEKSLHKLKSQLVMSETQSRESVVGELQVQLDRAHAQIITSDMVRKELEDTLEAEQYTWELRVQDQERTIVTLSQECRTLREDLEHCRSQWKEAEEGWTREVQELQSQLQKRSRASPTSNESVQPLQERLELLEREREELQSCLDEAMQELEAVDQELRQSPSSGVEPLQHLYRWLLERSDQDEEKMPDTANDLVEAIQSHIESIPSANLISNTDAALQVAELEAQISVYRGDLTARDEQTAELRSSLKEAVALLRPLQDAVSKSEREKEGLQEQLDELKHRQDPTEELQKRDRQIADLQKEIEDLTVDLIQMKQSSALSPERTSRSLQRSGEVGHEKHEPEPSSAKAKRDSERALQEMLKNAQGRFHALHQENRNVESANQDLRDRIKELEKELEDVKVKNKESVRRDVSAELSAELRETALQQLEQDILGYKQELQRKEARVIQLEEELILEHDKNVKKMEAEREKLREAAERVEDLESELSATKGDLEATKEAELVLTKSLKQALGLLRPLETHLETAEQEKRDLTKQLKACRKQIAKLEAGGSESRALGLPNEVEMRGDNGLTVRQLEQENAKLQNALEEVSQNLSFNGDENNRNQSRLHESLVELNSRYEVTQNKLERAVVENHALIDALKHKEDNERKTMGELRHLREELMRSNQELENAKFIATSALIKVEELTMANIEQMSLRREGVPIDTSMDYSGMKSPERRAIQARVKTLEIEVENASKVNKVLEGTLEDRERIVQSLTVGSSRESDEHRPDDLPKSQSGNGRHSRERKEYDPYQWL